MLDAPQAEYEGPLTEALKWWESKRLWFNVAVGVVGAASMVLFFKPSFGTPITDIMGAVAWGVVANIFYSVGFMAEAADHHYFKGRWKLEELRQIFWIVGTGAYVVVSFGFAWNYYRHILVVWQ